MCRVFRNRVTKDSSVHVAMLGEHQRAMDSSWIDRVVSEGNAEMPFVRRLEVFECTRAVRAA